MLAVCLFVASALAVALYSGAMNRTLASLSSAGGGSAGDSTGTTGPASAAAPTSASSASGHRTAPEAPAKPRGCGWHFIAYHPSAVEVEWRDNVAYNQVGEGHALARPKGCHGGRALQHRNPVPRCVGA